MDCQDSITEPAERKKGQHLQREERGAIRHLKRQGYSNRAIARGTGCSPSTAANKLRRGTPPRKSGRGRKPGYSARRGEAVCQANRKRSRRQHRIRHCARFLRWVLKQFRAHKRSLDACVGYARLHGPFPADKMVCACTLCNEGWAGNPDGSVPELPEALKRKQHKASRHRAHRKDYGRSITRRPEIAALRMEEGHWEGDTVVGKKAGKDAVVLSLLEKKTETCIPLQIPGRDTGWERPQNERHNGLFRAFVPKGVPIASFSPEYILPAADELNGMPRKKPGCRTPGGPFDKFPRLCLCSLWLQLHRPGCKPTLPSLTGALCD